MPWPTFPGHAAMVYDGCKACSSRATNNSAAGGALTASSAASVSGCCERALKRLFVPAAVPAETTALLAFAAYLLVSYLKYRPLASDP